MFVKVSLNLDIQAQYLDLLRDFLESEHKALQYGEFYNVYQLEKTIHKVLESIQAKRAELREELMGASVADFASEMPPYVGNMLRGKLDRLGKLEADCLARTSRNADLSLQLAGQKMAVPEHWNVFPVSNNAEGRVQ